MNGTDANTGLALSGIEHLRQSIRDILTTPIGSRVMRREYGSRLPRLVDRPMNDQGLVEIYAAAAEALDRWEPRLKVERFRAEQISGGKVIIGIEGRYLPDGSQIKLEGIIA